MENNRDLMNFDVDQIKEYIERMSMVNGKEHYYATKSGCCLGIISGLVYIRDKLKLDLKLIEQELKEEQENV